MYVPVVTSTMNARPTSCKKSLFYNELKLIGHLTSVTRHRTFASFCSWPQGTLAFTLHIHHKYHGRVHKKSHSTLTALGLLSSSSDHAFHVQTWAMRLLSASYSFNSSIYISCKHCTCVVPLQYCLQNSHSPTPRLWFHTSIEQRLVLLKCAIYEHCRTLYNKQPAA